MSDLKMTSTGDYMQSESLSAVRGIIGQGYGHLGYPDQSGYWLVGESFRIGVPKHKKPTPEQIKNTEQMFGWEWVDYE